MILDAKEGNWVGAGGGRIENYKGGAVETSPEINEIAKALSNVQQEALLAIKDANNPFFKSKYADLSSVWGVLRGPLSSNGLSVAQPLGYAEDGSPIVYTLLMHVSGQWIRGECRMRPEKDTPQALGSCVTYSRRYSLAAMCGVCPEDDDSEGAMSRGKPKPSQRNQSERTVNITKTLPPKQNTVTTDPGFPKAGPDATKEQYNAIFKMAQQNEITDFELTELANWFRVGEILSAKEAAEMITDFKGVLERYLDHIENLKK